jgi:gliding motility associated protien GldN
MKKILAILMMAFMVQTMSAQAPKSRVQRANTQHKASANAMTTRAQISFPTENKMSEDVNWRRDIYRELDLNDDANAGLYYPVEPMGTQMNLFTYMFKLMMRGSARGGIDAYEYTLDGNENFTDSAKIKPLKFLDDYHIYYERTDRGIRLENSDIPSAEVKGYYIKESAYYDQVSATFHTKVQAICPILSRDDDFGGKATKYPLFWVKYSDIAPFLAKQTIIFCSFYIYHMLGQRLPQFRQRSVPTQLFL